MGKIETIFEHGVTNEEWLRIRGYELEDKNEYMEDSEPEDIYQDLAYLYFYRGDEKKAKKYIDKTKDLNCISSFWRTVKHP